MSLIAEIDLQKTEATASSVLPSCPHCGPRPAVEFVCSGAAPQEAGFDPFVLDGGAWAEALFRRPSAAGLHYERWYHLRGCGLGFEALRDTNANIFHRAWPVAEACLLDAAE